MKLNAGILQPVIVTIMVTTNGIAFVLNIG